MLGYAMRKSWIIGGLVLVALAVAASWWRSTPPGNKPVEAVAVTDKPAPPAVTPPAAPAPPATDNPAPALAALPALPALPTRAIPEWRTHTVPEDEVPPAPKPLDLRVPSGSSAALPPPPSYRPSTSAPQQAWSGGGTGPQIAGTGEAAGAAALRVGGRPLHLFGIRPPASGDRCAAKGNTAPCLEQAEGLLAAKLAGKAKISCRFPGAARPDGPAICLDGNGVDLAGVLVAEGLALADPSQSYDYVGAEGVARSQKRGLWLFR
jgi:endonuclease YncB( thermonuclease family)